MSEPTQVDAQEQVRDILSGESKLVADVVTNCLNIIHNTEEGAPSILGEFIGLVGVTGGIGTAAIAASEPQYRESLAKFFAQRLETAASVFRRIEAGGEPFTE